MSLRAWDSGDWSPVFASSPRKQILSCGSVPEAWRRGLASTHSSPRPDASSLTGGHLAPGPAAGPQAVTGSPACCLQPGRPLTNGGRGSKGWFHKGMDTHHTCSCTHHTCMHACTTQCDAHTAYVHTYAGDTQACLQRTCERGLRAGGRQAGDIRQAWSSLAGGPARRLGTHGAGSEKPGPLSAPAPNAPRENPRTILCAFWIFILRISEVSLVFSSRTQLWRKSQYAKPPSPFRSYFPMSCWHSSWLMSRPNFSTSAADRSVSSVGGSVSVRGLRCVGSGSVARQTCKQACTRRARCSKEGGGPASCRPHRPGVCCPGFAQSPLLQSQQSGQCAV